jgi:transcription elongation factor Elf1
MFRTVQHGPRARPHDRQADRGGVEIQLKMAGATEAASRGDSMEHYFICPYCGDEISMILDLSVQRQTYVEDCEVCCNPIEITYTAQSDAVTSFAAKVLE